MIGILVILILALSGVILNLGFTVFSKNNWFVMIDYN